MLAKLHAALGVVLTVSCGLAGCHLVFSPDASNETPIDATRDAVVDGRVDGDTSISPNRAFITSTAFTGNLGGVEGANAKCNKVAGNATVPLAGTFIAVLATQNPNDNIYNALDLLKNSRGWIRTDGAFVADAYTDFAAGNLRNAIVLDENGKLAEATTIWTGLNRQGVSSTPNCTNFDDATDQSSVGDTGFRNLTLAAGPRSCATLHRLLCVSYGKFFAATPLPLLPKRNRIFLSQGTLGGNATLTNFDRLCNNEAAATLGTPAGAFSALLSVSTQSALTRAEISPTTVFTRIDRTPVAPFTGEPQTFLNQFADGTFPNPMITLEVWTGGMPTAAASLAETCSDWSMSLSGNPGITGNANSAASAAYTLTKEACTDQRHVYCVEK